MAPPPRPQSSSYPKFDTSNAVEDLGLGDNSEGLVGAGMFALFFDARW